MTSPTWRQIENPDHERWKENSVVCSYVGLVYFVLRHRNAYNWARSNTFSWNAAFFPSLAQAKAYIETRRERGSGWTIDEYPALVIAGEDYAICIASAEDREQFRGLQGASLSHKTIQRIAQTLHESRNRRIFIYYTDTNTVAALDKPLVRYSSRTLGGQYRLSWKAVVSSPVGMGAILDLQKKVWSLIRKDA